MREDSGIAPSILERVRAPEPLLAVELRPPRSGVGARAGMEQWIDLRHAVRRLARRAGFVLFTDSAVGEPEEESLLHLESNLGEEAPFPRIAPFLTCKHALDYCRIFAQRAQAKGVGALAVVGGDKGGGPPRCVPRGQELRRIIRAECASIPLGGWANPHRDPEGQAQLVAAEAFCADFVLTQVMSHHSLPAAERFLAELDRLGCKIPVVFGVFYYRSARPETLARLGRFFPVPERQIRREFSEGASPVDFAARTLSALDGLGAPRSYLSNLGIRRPERVFEEINRRRETRPRCETQLRGTARARRATT